MVWIPIGLTDDRFAFLEILFTYLLTYLHVSRVADGSALLLIGFWRVHVAGGARRPREGVNNRGTVSARTKRTKLLRSFSYSGCRACIRQRTETRLQRFVALAFAFDSR